MAGSYNHCTQKIQGESQFIGLTLLDPGGDCLEALEELWFIVRLLANDSDEVVARSLEQFNRPTSAIAVALKARLQLSLDNEYWEGQLDSVVEETP